MSLPFERRLRLLHDVFMHSQHITCVRRRSARPQKKLSNFLKGNVMKIYVNIARFSTHIESFKQAFWLAKIRFFAWGLPTADRRLL